MDFEANKLELYKEVIERLRYLPFREIMVNNKPTKVVDMDDLSRILKLVDK